MCGISGIFNIDESPVNIKDLEKMNQAMIHRGPNDCGSVLISTNYSPIEFDSDFNSIGCSKQTGIYHIGFTHRRLSIVDLSFKGHQPMTDNKKRIWLVFNGEIYNYVNIREQLKAKGHSFISQSDSEVIIYAYKEWGIDCIKRFEGVFAFAIWDLNNKLFYIVRDRVGIKPLYYIIRKNTLYFASEIKSLLSLDIITRKLNKKSLSYYFSFLSVPAPHTMFAGINKIPPGSYIEVKNKNIKCFRYWDALINAKKNEINNSQLINEVEKRLEYAITQRMMSDVPFGVFLSGGLDSSLITAILCKHSDSPINTFTIGYKGLKNNEFQYAKMVSKQYNTNHHELLIDGNNAEELISDMVYHQDEPIADPVCIPILLLSRKAKEEGISVIQVGEGADEIFAGYENYKTYYKIHNRFWKNIHKYPQWFKRTTAVVGKHFLAGTKYRKYSDYFDFMVENKELFWNNAHKFYPSDLERLLQYKEYDDPYSFILNNVKHFNKTKSSEFFEKLAYQELKLRLPELLLMRVDKMSMAASVEGRVPFLDHNLIEFSIKIQDSQKMKNMETKYIIKRIAEKYLDSEIIYRKKQGFGFPINHFFSDGFDEYLKTSINNSKLKQEDIINYDFVNEMFELSKNGKVNYHSNLWSLANLSMWYDLWFA